jgi:hypothetical protein
MERRAAVLKSSVLAAVVVALAGVTGVTGCHAHRAGGYHHHHAGHRTSPLAPLLVGVAALAALGELAERERRQEVRVVVEVQQPAAAVTPAPGQTLHAWVVCEGLLLQDRLGVPVVISGPYGVTMRLMTTDGHLHIPLPLPQGRYTATIEHHSYRGSARFEIGAAGLMPKLFIFARPVPAN